MGLFGKKKDTTTDNSTTVVSTNENLNNTSDVSSTSEGESTVDSTASISTDTESDDMSNLSDEELLRQFDAEYGMSSETEVTSESSSATATEDSSDKGDNKGITGAKILDDIHKVEKNLNKLSDIVQGIDMVDVSMLAENISRQVAQDKLFARTIAFYGASGGVGTTTMLMEIAQRLSANKKKVLIIDLVPEGSLYRRFFANNDLMSTPPQKDLIDLVDGSANVKQSIMICKGGISILNCAKRGIDSTVKFDGDLVADSFEALLETFEQVYDFILIDCGSRLENLLVNNTLYGADKIFIVTDGGMSSLHRLAGASSNFAYCGISKNKTYIIHNKSTTALTDKISNLGFKMAYTIPYLESIKTLQLQAKLLGNNFIYSEAKYVTAAKDEFDLICKDLLTSVFEANSVESEEVEISEEE